VEIRKGEARDLAEIAAIQEASPEAAAWPPRDYLGYDLLVAVRSGRVAGFLASRKTAEKEWEILNLAVAPDCRRKGAGRALVEAFLAEKQGDVFLEVRESNTTAREFYNSLEFQVVSRRDGYYHHPPEAAIVMKFHSC